MKNSVITKHTKLRIICIQRKTIS